jgi:PPOX class probable F420-dependent enzyme
MELSRARCRHLVEGSEHGVLATSHAVRGVDAVPVCFAVDGELVAIPIDRLKPKASAQLQRTRNLDRDPRAALLCDYWDGDDWSRLWWVRATLERIAGSTEEQSSLETLLRRKYRQYADHAFAEVLAFRITEMTGWSAGPGAVGLP